jgi:hypothetical protein
MTVRLALWRYATWQGGRPGLQEMKRFPMFLCGRERRRAMTIEIHRPELEALILERMERGDYENLKTR